MTLSIIIVNYNVEHFLHQCLKSIETATVRDGNLRFIDGVKGWNSKDMDELRPEKEDAINYQEIPGPSIPVESGIFSDSIPQGWVLRIQKIPNPACCLLKL